MDFLDNFPVWLHLVAIIISATGVWISGKKLSHYAGIIAERSGLGQAVIGAVLLGGITSLPEIATTITAALIGSAPIAVNNIIGGVSMQVAVLAVADAFAIKTALSFRIDDPKVKIQAVFNIVLLTTALAGTIFTDIFKNFPFWTLLILALYLGSFYLMNLARKDTKAKSENKQDDSGISNGKLAYYTSISSVVILIAGFVISVSGENIAGRTVFGENFVGAVLIAATTSLPELSTTIAAVKENNFNLAASNIFGSNLLILSLLFVGDVAYQNGNVLDKVEKFSQFGSYLGILLCSIYLTGFILNRNKTVFNFGVDSLIILIMYFSGLVVLYFLK